jgi:hypothetical protein
MAYYYSYGEPVFVKNRNRMNFRIPQQTLLASVGVDKHADYRMHDMPVLLVKPLQIFNDRQVFWLNAIVQIRRLSTFPIRFISAKAKPFGGHAEPLRERAQFFLGRNCFADDPLAGRVNGDRRTVETDIEFARQLGWTVRGIIRTFQRLLQAPTEIQSLFSRHVYAAFPIHG